MKKFSEFSFWGCLHLITKCDAKVVNSSNISKLLYKKLYNINRKFIVVRLTHYIAIGQLHTLCYQV